MIESTAKQSKFDNPQGCGTADFLNRLMHGINDSVYVELGCDSGKLAMKVLSELQHYVLMSHLLVSAKTFGEISTGEIYQSIPEMHMKMRIYGKEAGIGYMECCIAAFAYIHHSCSCNGDGVLSRLY